MRWMLAAVVTAAACGQGGTGGHGGAIAWRTDVDAAVQEAAAAHKPVMLYFSADW